MNIKRKKRPISHHKVPPGRSNKVKTYFSSVGSPCKRKLSLNCWSLNYLPLIWKTLKHGYARWAPAPHPLSRCPIVPMTQYPSVQVSQCLCVPVSQCPGVPASQYHSVQVSWCPSVLVSHCPIYFGEWRKAWGADWGSYRGGAHLKKNSLYSWFFPVGYLHPPPPSEG